jgi:nitrite reductase/ring-hydroxylating ferredoxin subunit
VRSISELLADELGAAPDEAEPASRAPRPALATLLAPAAIARGAIRGARDGERAVAVARLASGALVVVEDECPHDGGPISDGFVDGERIVCARHGWEWEARGGRCVRARSASCGKQSNS